MVTINGVKLSEFSIVKTQGGECCDFAVSLFREYTEKAFGFSFRTDGERKIFFNEKGKDENVKFCVENGSLWFYGGNRGIIYSVLEFLETIGWRFFTPSFEKFIGKQNYDMPNGFNYEYIPPFWYRQNIFKCSQDDAWSVKHKINVEWKRVLPSFMGGGIEYAGPEPAHTFSYLMPPEKYFGEFPECFALSEDGTRSKKQPCLSQKKTFEIMLENALRWLDEQPDANIISITQNDNWLQCQCPKCVKARKKYGSSGLLLRFVNRIAREIGKKYPSVLIETFAYDQNLPAPKKTVAEDNVIVRFCTKGRCFLHNLDDENSVMCKNVYKSLLDWKKAAKNLQIWEYAASFNYNLIGFPVNDRYLHDANIYFNCGVSGILTEGQHLGNSCNFTEMTSYLHSKLAWKPAMDIVEYQRLKNEFIDNYYGNSSPYIKEYLNILDEYTENMIIDMTPAPFSWIPQFRNGEQWGAEYFAKSYALFNKAFVAADNQTIYDRVEKEFLQPLYYWSEMLFANDMLNEKEHRKQNLLLLEKLYELIDKYDIKFVRIGGSRTGVDVRRKNK